MNAATMKGPKWILRCFLPFVAGYMMRQARRFDKKRVMSASQGLASTRPMLRPSNQSPSPTHLPLEMR